MKPTPVLFDMSYVEVTDRSYTIGKDCDHDALLDLSPDESNIIPSEVIRGLWHSNFPLNDRLQVFNALLSLDQLHITRGQLSEYEDALRHQEAMHGSDDTQRSFLTYVHVRTRY